MIDDRDNLQAARTLDGVDDHVSGWKRVSGGPDGDSHIGRDPHRGRPAELRILCGVVSDPDRVTNLVRRLRLIQLADCAGIRRVLASQLDHPPGRVVMAMAAGSQSLRTAAESLNNADRLQLASQIVSAFLAADHVGLQHGRFNESCVRVHRDPDHAIHCEVDFTGLRCETSDAAEQDDALALKAVFWRLLLPCLDDLSIDDSVRTRLRQAIEAVEAPALEDWQRVLPTEHNSPTPTAQLAVSESPTAPGFTPTFDSESTFDLGTGAGATPGSPSVSASVPEQLGRFKIESKIGEGGMGTVYRGVDLADDQPVAVKVLRRTSGDIGRAVRRFRKEARLLADAQNDNVTRLIEVGEQDGRHYLAMELVEGVDLKSWLEHRTHLEEREALSLVADIARALVDAHSKEVIHRDIKPENVLLQWRDPKLQSTDPAKHSLSEFRVKLTDFGIARHVTQTSSMEVTQAGMLLGTPRYMAPEQFEGGDNVSPAADVYSLGVTLFELLAGKPPFEAKDVMQLATLHRHTEAPSLLSQNITVTDLTARLVARTLAKDPAKRFGDAGQMLAEIESVLHGQAIAIEAHPKSPGMGSRGMGSPGMASRPVWDKTKTWDLHSSPDQLWHYVSNTERLNHAIGLPAVDYTTQKDPDLGLRKFGAFRLAGLPIAWEEHPFEWIEGKRMGILREFTSGPFRWFLSVVTLESRPGGGTRLSHRIRIEPRSLVGRLLTTVEADWKGFRNLDKVYRRIDRSVQGQLGHDEGDDAFERVKKLGSAKQSRLSERIEQIIDDGVDPSVAAKLREAISSWASQEISQLRPLQMADTFGIDGQTMVDACLIAASRGLLQLRWDVLCPTCRAPAATSDQLADIAAHTGCEACDVEFQSNVGDAIEMVFRVHPEIRTVNDAQYCIGGPEHSPHVVAQIRIEPGERFAATLDLGGGDFLIRGPRLPRTQSFRIRDQGAPSSYQTTLSALGEGVHVPVLRRGQQTITLTNDLSVLHVVRVERMVPRDDVVTATAAAAMRKFRELFPSQSFDADNPVSTNEVTLLATSINDIESVYANMGDTEAYNLTHQLTNLITRVVTAEGGTVTKTMGEKLLAAFPRRDQAVHAAIRIRADISESDSCRSLSVGVGIHSGPTLVTTENHRLDYFGSSVRGVNSLAELAEARTLMTEPVFTDPIVKSALSSSSEPTIQPMTLMGIGETCVRELK